MLMKIAALLTGILFYRSLLSDHAAASEGFEGYRETDPDQSRQCGRLQSR